MDKIKILEAKLPTVITSLEKIDLLNELAWELRNQDPKCMQDVSQLALELAGEGEFENKPYQPGQAKALCYLSISNINLANHQLALSQANQALDIYQ